MSSIIRSFQDLLSLNSSVVYSNILWLHYPLTLTFMIMEIVVTTGMTFIGDPIDCTNGFQTLFSQKMIDNFCLKNPKIQIPSG